MPLDELQKAVLRVLLRNRTPDSVFAGGSVLQRHGHRLSADQDIFHAETVDLRTVAERDLALLGQQGFAVDLLRPREGLVEAMVGTAELGATRIQWLLAGTWQFFAPVPDPDYGWRLHMADLAVNKVLAAGDRRQVRDYVDLAMIHQHLLPLWQAIWAAPGKDDSWSPRSLAERLAMNNNFRQADLDQGIVSTIPVSAAAIGRTLRTALDEARAVFEQLPDDTAGRLFVDAGGEPVTAVAPVLAGTAIALEARRGGTWPSGPEIDHALIARVIAAFGRDGGVTA